MGSCRVIKVAIIGAGSGGLCALRHLAGYRNVKSSDENQDLVQFEPVCFEQTSKVGGTWAYTDRVGQDEHGNPIHSSMYINLKTTLPRHCMAFPDFPFPTELPSFVRHQDVQNYLESYAEHFGVRKYIRFQRRVSHIKPVKEEGALFGTRWEVATHSVLDSERRDEADMYDAIIICNGNYSTPAMPTVPGSENFQGELFHSHDYRKPEPYKGQTVVLLGANNSGQDIALELSNVVEKVYLSHNKKTIESRLPDNVEQRPGIQRLDSPSQVTFLDGSTVHADTVIYCTGYLYDHRFLSPECGVEVNDYRVTPLYKHLINTKFPSMAILGVPKSIIPFPFFDVQVRFFRSVLEGSHVLPSEAAMNEDIDRDYRTRQAEGRPHRFCHEMSGRLFKYLKELPDLAGIDHLPEFYERAHSWAVMVRRTDVMNYKTFIYPH